MKTLIIEDEALAVKKLVKMLGEIDTAISICGITDSIESSVNWLQKNPAPELILMDIELADGQSFEIFKHVNVTSSIIFVTSYDEYAIKAFKVNSIDYLLKPIKKEELTASLAKMKQVKLQHTSQITAGPDIISLIKELQAQSKTKEYRERFLVRLGQRLVSVEIDEVAFFYTDKRVNLFKTRSNMKYMVDYSIDELDALVDPKKFFRINRQFLVGINSIEEIHNYFNGRLLLRLKPAIELEVIVSREKVNDFKDWMGK